MSGRVGFDEQGKEIAQVEMKNLRVGGIVTADLVGQKWRVVIDDMGRLVVAEHEYRHAAILIALGNLMGYDVEAKIQPEIFEPD